MMAIQLSGKHRTCLIRIAADGDDRLTLATQKFIHVLAVVCTDVDVYFRHCVDRHGVDVSGGLGSGARHFHKVSQIGAQYSLGKMTPAGISGTKNEYQWFHYNLAAMVCR